MDMRGNKFARVWLFVFVVGGFSLCDGLAIARDNVTATDKARGGAEAAPTTDPINGDIVNLHGGGADPVNDAHAARESIGSAPESALYWSKMAVFVSIGQAFFAGLALLGLIFDIRQGRKSIERQLRAYIVVSEIDICDHPRIPNSLCVSVKFQNQGSTPAIDVIVRQRFQSFSLDENPDAFKMVLEELEDAAFSSRSVLPINATHASIAHGLPLEAMKSVKAGKIIIISYGYIKYKDVFNIPRITKFRFHYGQEELSIGSNLMIPSPVGNSII